ncbi:cell wall hydrolase [Clostridium sp. DL1XJH146]
MESHRYSIFLSILLFSMVSFCTIANAKTEIGTETLDLFKDETQVVTVFNSDWENIGLTDEDIDLMARVVFAESNLEPYDGKVAVASVILNRLKDEDFPNTIEGVINQKWAFTCVSNGTVNRTPDEECYRAVYDALKGYDPTTKATFYYNPKIATCSWMKTVEKNNVSNIGQHVFFTVE